MKIKKYLVRLMITVLCLPLISFAISCDQPTTSIIPVTPTQSSYTDNSSSSNGQCGSGAICQKEQPGSYERRGPYNTGRYKLGIKNATVYYPTDVDTKVGAMVFTPPFTGVQAMYQAWGPWFASHGIISVLMDTTTPMDVVDSRARQQYQVVERLKSNAGQAANILDTNRIGVMGWSMGGGATWITSGKHPRDIKMLITLAGHNMTSMDPASKGNGVTSPMLCLNGATDATILGGMGQSETSYRNARGPKIICVTTPAGHFSWGSPTSGGSGVASLTLAFTKRFLYDDTRWTPFIKKPARTTKYETSGIN